MKNAEQRRTKEEKENREAILRLNRLCLRLGFCEPTGLILNFLFCYLKRPAMLRISATNT